MITTEEKKGGSRTAPVTNNKTDYRSVGLFLEHKTWWHEAERLALLFRRTRDERHLMAFAVHLDGVYERLTGKERII